MDFFLCLNHNVISPETIKEHHPDAADVLDQWAGISDLPPGSLYVVFVGATTAVVYHRNAKDEIRVVFIMTGDHTIPIDVLVENMNISALHRPLVDPTTLFSNKKYTSIYCDERYEKIGGYHLRKFIHDELTHKCQYVPQAAINNSIKERLSNFGIELGAQYQLLDNKGRLVVIDKEQGFVVLNLRSYFLPEEIAHFLGPDSPPWYPSEIDMPVRYDFIIGLTKDTIPYISQWVPRLEITKEVAPQLRKEVSMKSPLKNDKVTQTLLSGMEKLDVPEQLLKPVVVTHEVPDHAAGQRVVALQNCLYTTKSEVTIDVILDGIKARYEAMEKPISVIYAYRVNLHKVKIYGGDGLCLLTVTRSESDPKLSVVCKDEDFFFSEEKQKIGEWLINNYYGVC